MSAVGSAVSVQKPERTFSQVSSKHQRVPPPRSGPQPILPSQNPSSGPAMYNSNNAHRLQGLQQQQQQEAVAGDRARVLLDRRKQVLPSRRRGQASPTIPENDVVISKCIRIAPPLNTIARHANSPDGTAPTPTSLANMLSRVDEDDTPFADAATWHGITQYQDGESHRGSSSRQTVLTTLQLVPERLPPTRTRFWQRSRDSRPGPTHAQDQAQGGGREQGQEAELRQRSEERGT